MVLLTCDLRSKVFNLVSIYTGYVVHFICPYKRTKLSTVTLLFLTYRPVLEYLHASGALRTLALFDDGAI